jgi:hypothetical protein
MRSRDNKWVPSPAAGAAVGLSFNCRTGGPARTKASALLREGVCPLSFPC